MQWVPKEKEKWYDTGYSTVSTGEIKYANMYTSTPPYVFTARFLVRQRRNS
jgi:hypothetical protein